MANEDARRLRQLIDSVPAMVSYWDRALCNVVANDAFIEFFGKTPGEIRGRHLREVLGEDLFRLSRPHVEGVLAGAKQVFEHTLTDRHGGIRHVETNYIPDAKRADVDGFYVLVTDVTSRVEAERARDDAVRLLRISMENAPIGQSIVDTSLRALYVNPTMCAMFGYTVAELNGMNLREFVHPDDIATAEADFDVLKNSPLAHVVSELRLFRRDGTAIWVQRSAVMVPGAHGSDDVFIGQFQDITARKQAEAELARQVVTDALTGLGNRKAFLDYVRSQRETEPASAVGIVFVDLDEFKQINDTYGHVVGDAVLIQVAQRIAQIVGSTDSVYRLGGDEFVVLCTKAEAQKRVATLASRLRRALTGTYDTGGKPLTLSASVGSTWGPTHDIQQLLHDADAHMYQHKALRRVR
jgi:diguanylate cyclase (GGDEF)-like protein/PAS domain S-box-containing protein